MYTIHKFMLTNSQLKKIKHALDEDKNISLKILDKNFHGEHSLPVTETEMKHVHNGEGYVNISLSKKKLQHIRDQKEGGILPLLSLIPLILGGIGTATAIAGGAAGIAQAVNSKKLEESKLEEQARHNREVENNLKSGSGMKESMKRESFPLRSNKNIVGCTDCPACGSGLLLKYKHNGKGLYLKPFSGSHTGLGLITAIGDMSGNPATHGVSLSQAAPLPQSLADIPIIGSILKMIY